MRKRIIAKKLFGVICFYSLISLAVILMAMAELMPETVCSVIKIISGAMFWIGLFGGISSYLLLYKRCRVIIHEALGKCSWPGLSFFSNKAAVCVDLILIISAVANLLFITIINPPGFLGWFVLFVFITSLYYHFLLNGRVFKYILLK